jgi:hypothetical protein
MDTADQSVLTRAAALAAPLPLARARPRKIAPAPLKMNRQEHVIFTAYLAMIAQIVTFLAVSGLVVWLGA